MSVFQVGALEVKLMSCRNIVKETSPGGGSGTGSTPGSGSATPGKNKGLNSKVSFDKKHFGMFGQFGPDNGKNVIRWQCWPHRLAAGPLDEFFILFHHEKGGYKIHTFQLSLYIYGRISDIHTSIMMRFLWFFYSR